MRIEYDEEKSRKNALERNLPFSIASEFDFKRAWIWLDTRYDYGEKRYTALGEIRGRVHTLAFCYRLGAIRVISLRKSNQREEKKYADYRAQQSMG